MIGKWVEMYNNPKYLVNPDAGEIKSLSSNYCGRILKGRVVYTSENGKAKCVYHTIILPNGKRKSMKEHRIVAEAVLKKDLSGVSIGHKNGCVTDNLFSNLLIGQKTNNAHKIRVEQYFKGEYQKTYTSIRAFERETGISHHCFVKANGNRVIKRYAYTFILVEELKF